MKKRTISDSVSLVLLQPGDCPSDVEIIDFAFGEHNLHKYLVYPCNNLNMREVRREDE